MVFGKTIIALNGFDYPLPVDVCSGNNLYLGVLYPSGNGFNRNISTLNRNSASLLASVHPHRLVRNGLIIEKKLLRRLKEQILQEEASLAEAIRLDTLEKEEEAKQVHLDSLLAQRLAEEEELNEQQKQRRAQVHVKSVITDEA
ncbi:hypothetical protein Tco_0375290 [Tanacetum coccineum]